MFISFWVVCLQIRWAATGWVVYGRDICASYFCDEWEDKLSKGFHSTTFEMKKEKKKKQKVTSLK